MKPDNNKVSEFIQTMWKFARDDLSTVDFEQWVYKTSQLENILGRQLYFDLIACDYRDPNKAWEMKEALKKAIDQLEPRQCDCVTWKTDQEIPTASEAGRKMISEALIILKKQTPWLNLSRCQHCGQYWYVAVDTFEDVYFIYRLKTQEAKEILATNVWPSVFDDLEMVWPNQKWLDFNGYKSLKDWQERNNQARQIS